MTFVLIFIAGALLVLLVTMIANLLIFPKLSTLYPLDKSPLVSILIPARNEATVIEQTVKAHLAQDYPNFEVIIMDDKSDDGTGDIARGAGNGDERLRVVNGTELPSGWMGKSWACHNLAQQARGDVLIFTDADVQWQPSALSQLVGQMQATQVDMLTVWSTQVTETMAERLTVPLMAMVILGYLPTVMVHYSPFSLFAAANGQCMAWRRETYEAISGHTVVAHNVLDDVTLATEAKKKGYKIRMVDGAGLIRTRMYDGWSSVRDGFAKNILAGYGNSVPFLIFGIFFHWMLWVVPYILLFMPEYRLAGLVLIMGGLVLRIVSAIFTRQRVWDGLLMPITVVLFTIIAVKSIYWHYAGGPQWKGRTLSKGDSA